MKERITAANDTIQRLGISKNELARRTGMSSSTVSTVLNGTYSGDEEKVLYKIEQVLSSMDRKERVFFAAPEFVPTSTWTKMERMFTDAVDVSKPRITVLYGPSGIGKTFSIEHFAETTPSAVLFKVRPDYSAKAVLGKLAQGLGLSPQGANYEITDRIIDRLKGSERLVIFDEAEYLKPGTLDIIRRIHDEARVPVALVGMTKLYHIISSLRNNFEQIANRMISYNLMANDKKDLQEDIKKVISAALKGQGQEVINAFIDEMPNSIREAVLLMQDVINYSGRSGQAVTQSLVRAYRNTQH